MRTTNYEWKGRVVYEKDRRYFVEDPDVEWRELTLYEFYDVRVIKK